MPTEREKMLAGELYDALDSQLIAERGATEATLRSFNAGGSMDRLRGLLASVGEGTVVRAPFFCDYGSNIFLGSGVFLNFGCVLLDVVAINIGDGSQIGPGVQIYAADHPRDAEVRRAGLELGRPVSIGCNVWIGGGAIILPGVTVGNDAVIGAGSVVTRDVPPGTVVVGNPARARASAGP